MSPTAKRAILIGSAGLAVTGLGAFTFILFGTDAWPGILGLVVVAAGLGLLFRATAEWMRQFPRPAAGGKFGCATALTRVGLILILIAAVGAWCLLAGRDLNELRLILTAKRTAWAQVIGRDIVAPGARTGFVHYAYRVSRTVAPESNFPVPVGRYPDYRIGARLQVTYSAADPKVHRLGPVTLQSVTRRFLYWLLTLVNIGACLVFPLWLLEYRRGATKRTDGRVRYRKQ